MTPARPLVIDARQALIRRLGRAIAELHKAGDFEAASLVAKTLALVADDSAAAVPSTGHAEVIDLASRRPRRP